MADESVNSSVAHHFVNTVNIKLTNTNFLLWKTQVVPFLRSHELMGFVDGTNPCPNAFLPVVEGAAAAQPNPLYASWVRQDQAVLSMLISSLSPKVMHLAIGRTTSRALWLAVEEAHASFMRVGIAVVSAYFVIITFLVCKSML